MLACRTLVAFSGTSRHLHDERPAMRASRGVAWTLRSVANGRPVGVCDERSREREQTDCEHDERALQ